MSAEPVLSERNSIGSAVKGKVSALLIRPDYETTVMTPKGADRLVNEGWGRRLRDAKRDWEARNDRDLPYREIGEWLGSTAVAANRYFMGYEPARFEIAEKLALHLGVNPGWLVFGPEYCAKDLVQLARFDDARLADAARKRRKHKRG